MNISFGLDKLRRVSPDLKEVNVVTEPRGWNGWLVHLCFSNNKCADFQVDEGNYDQKRMAKAVERAIVRQLQHHEANKG